MRAGVLCHAQALDQYRHYRGDRPERDEYHETRCRLRREEGKRRGAQQDRPAAERQEPVLPTGLPHEAHVVPGELQDAEDERMKEERNGDRLPARRAVPQLCGVAVQGEEVHQQHDRLGDVPEVRGFSREGEEPQVVQRQDRDRAQDHAVPDLGLLHAGVVETSRGHVQWERERAGGAEPARRGSLAAMAPGGAGGPCGAGAPLAPSGGTRSPSRAGA